MRSKVNVREKAEDVILKEGIYVIQVLQGVTVSIKVENVKGIKINVLSIDCDPMYRSEYLNWILIHEISHLNHFFDTMYSPNDGTQTIIDKERRLIKYAIRDFINPDELFDVFVKYRGDMDEIIDAFGLPPKILVMAFDYYYEGNEKFRNSVNRLREELSEF